MPVPEPIEETISPLPLEPQAATSSGFIWQGIRTLANQFGVYREYPCIPTHDPDENVSLANLADTVPPLAPDSTGTDPVDSLPIFSRLAPIVRNKDPNKPSYHPFRNATVYGIMNWMWSGSAMKSVQEVVKLLTFLRSDDFKKDDLQGFDIKRETANFDKILEDVGGDHGNANVKEDSWREVEVNIKVPDRQAHANEEDIPHFSVSGLWLRPLTGVIRSVFSDPSSKSFHYTPFKEFWQATDKDQDAQRVYDEIYSSDAMIEAHTEVQNLPPETETAPLERVVASLMFWSDSTHLASFGTASLWPVYLFFGNQSKWMRCKPTSGACHHVAYIPKVRYLQLISSSLNDPSNDLIHMNFSCHPSLRTFISILLGIRLMLTQPLTAAMNLCMKSGVCFLTTNSWKHMSMVL